MPHELSIFQARICFFVVDQLRLLAGLCGLLEMSVSLRDTRHCLCCNIPSDLLTVVVALWVGFWFLHPWSPRIWDDFIDHDPVPWFWSCLFCWFHHPWTWFRGGLVVSSKVTRCGSVGMACNSGIGSGSGVLLRMLSSFVNASICSNPLWFLFPCNACVRSFSALVIKSAGVMVGCVMNFVLKNTMSDTLLLFVCFT